MEGQPGELLNLPLPLRAGYAFGGWFTDAELLNPFMGKFVPESNLTLYAKWVLDTTDYAAILVQYIASRDGWDPVYNLYEIEQTIMMYEMVFQTTEDYATYFYIVAIDEAMRDMTTVAALSSVQEIWLDLDAKGIDEEMVVGAVMTMMMYMVDQEIAGYDPQWFLDQIADYQAGIVTSEALIAQKTLDLRAYCATISDGLDDDCDGLFDLKLQMFHLNQYYIDLLNQYGNDMNNSFWYGDWYDLENYLQSWFYSNKEPYYYQKYLDQLQWYDVDTRTLYENAGNAYIAFMEVQFDIMDIENNVFSGVYDSNEDYVRDVINSFYFTITNELYMLDSYAWMIEEAYQWQARAARDFERMVYMKAYLESVEGHDIVHTALMSIYGMAEHMIMNLDPALFDLVYGLVTRTISPEDLDFTPAGIHGYLQHVLALLTTMEGGMDEADFANLRELAKDLIYVALWFEDMDLETKTALIPELQAAIDVYFVRLLDAYDTVKALMSSLTVDQIAQIFDYVMMFAGNQGGGIMPTVQMVEQPRFDPLAQADLIIAIAGLINDIAGPQKEGIARIITYVIIAKFDAEYMFQYDEAELLLLTTSAYDNVIRLFELLDIIEAIELDTLTPEQAMALDEFVQRADYLGMLLALPPWMMQVRTEFGYNVENFNGLLMIVHRDLAYRNELVDAARQMYVDTFGMSEANTYYFMLSMIPTILDVQSVESYASAKLWVDSLDRLGFTNLQIATFVVRYASARSAYEIYRNEMIYQENIAYYTQQIADYEQQLLEKEADLIAFEQDVDAFLATLDPETAQLILDYWNALKLDQQRKMEFRAILDQYRYDNDYQWMWDEYSFMMLTQQLESIAYEEMQIAYNQAKLASKLVELDAYCAAFGEPIDQDCDGFAEQYRLSTPVRNNYYELFELYVNEMAVIDWSSTSQLITHLYNWYWTGQIDHFNQYETELAAIDESVRMYYETLGLAYMAWQDAIHPYEALISNLVDINGGLLVYLISDMVNMILHYEALLDIATEKLDMYGIQYADQFAMLDSSYQMMFGPMLLAFETSIEINYTVLQPMESFFNENYQYSYERGFVLNLFYSQYMNTIWSIQNINFELEWMYRELGYQNQNDNGPADLIVEVLADPINEALAIEIVELMLNRFDLILLEADPATMELLVSLVMGQINPTMLDLSPEGIEGYAAQVAALLDLLLGDVLPADLDKVQTLLGKVLWIQMTNEGLAVEQVQAIYDLFNLAFDRYVPTAFELVDALVIFLNAIEVADVQTVMNQIMAMNAIDNAENQAYIDYYELMILTQEQFDEILFDLNMARAIAMANIVTAVLGDGTLDTDLILETALLLYFDITYQFDYQGEIVIADLILDYQSLIDDIVLQAAVIDGYDVNLLGLLEYGQIEVFHLLIEEVMAIIEYGPEGYSSIPV
jgi:uncharacterized repeat protein (TIGR02543 family)